MGGALKKSIPKAICIRANSYLGTCIDSARTDIQGQFRDRSPTFNTSSNRISLLHSLIYFRAILDRYCDTQTTNLNRTHSIHLPPFHLRTQDQHVHSIPPILCTNLATWQQPQTCISLHLPSSASAHYDASTLSAPFRAFRNQPSPAKQRHKRQFPTHRASKTLQYPQIPHQSKSGVWVAGNLKLGYNFV